MSSSQVIRGSLFAVALMGATTMTSEPTISTATAYEISTSATSDMRRQGVPSFAGTGSLQTASPWTPYVEERLSDLSLERYDFTDLRVPSPSTIARAASIALDTFDSDTATPSVVPSEEGSVLFVWHRFGWDVELAVSSISTIVWANRREDATGWYGPLSEYGEEFTQLLRGLSRGSDPAAAGSSPAKE